MKNLRLGTRGSRLALWQAQHVAFRLESLAPDLKVEIKTIKTIGDKILDVALSKIGDKGLFTKEIEKELLAGKIDIAVHSMKDLPSDLPPGLCIAAVLEREDPRDVLLSHKNYSLAELPEGAVIGTSSLRRIAQLKVWRSDLQLVDMRGNVETRIRKMKEQDLDGIILACAGVKRLGLEGMISDYLPADLVLPAVGQGMIAVEARADDPVILEALSRINHQDSYLAGQAERAFLHELGGGCQVPVASMADLRGGQLHIQGLIASLDGKEKYSGTCACSPPEAEKTGRELARSLLQQGGAAILCETRG
ncbi:MAG: hydroxymethylbilane synthase [Syntrophomonas sp.]|uniref:hydroxymethylbilane synthase n=1 Tax=Syntrophomonas sp. TaxID=2053627 RepID=UPI00262EDA7F|nr:hydroxymethylbilane synthase [Syntrophomonas sp.]MDD2510423.1 hydroxymethylbilane synthase [Syntrophomonas sp.]MDD3878466.1 hydroxymethylbilane synthase [Syntrophomonas sp.]MDD4625884.1 hydroxymethylbilane synthase [Syntrophomonas sp.]